MNTFGDLMLEGTARGGAAGAADEAREAIVKLMNWPPEDPLDTRSRAAGQQALEHGNRIAMQAGALEPEMRSRTDHALGALTGAFRARLTRGESLDSLLPEAFAAVREAAVRVLGWRPLDGQLIGGTVLHAGKIAEMRAAEGKTLTVVLAAYLNALPGDGVHVLTADGYLAARDAGRMGALYRFLGLSIGLLGAAPTADEQRAAYAADVTYGAWDYYAYDYLRENLAQEPEHIVQRGHRLAIADDADLILLDRYALQPRICSAEQATLAEVRMCDYLGQYQRLAGLAGVATASAASYRAGYQLDVVPVPPARPVIRVDHRDAVRGTRQAKLAALADEAAERHATGQPVLVGARSADEAQAVSGLLAERGVGHEVLTGADEKHDAQVLAGAGRRGAVTIIAGMAGRGTGIRLGGADGAGHDEVATLGGLCVLGTARPALGRHELDLRDLAGTQGDPGEATFFVALEDDHPGPRLAPRLNSFMARHTRTTANPTLSMGIDNGQAWAAAGEAEQMSRQRPYAAVLAGQQHMVYARRRAALHGDGLSETIRSMIDEVIRSLVETGAGQTAWPDRLWRDLRELYPVGVTLATLAAQCGCAEAALPPEFIATQVAADAQRAYDRRRAELSEPVIRELERRVTLALTDRAWSGHLQAMSELRRSLAHSADGSVPLPEYQHEAAQLFAAMNSALQRETVHALFNLEVTPGRPEV
jgi:preprotein translocase subunit SecA